MIPDIISSLLTPFSVLNVLLDIIIVETIHSANIFLQIKYEPFVWCVLLPAITKPKLKKRERGCEMAAVVFYRAPIDGLGLRKLKTKNKQKKTHYNDQKRLFSKKIIIYNLFKASPMRHTHPF